MDHILEITQPGTKIRFENELLILDSPEKEAFSVPINETGALLLTHSGVSVSGAVLFRLADPGPSRNRSPRNFRNTFRRKEKSVSCFCRNKRFHK